MENWSIYLDFCYCSDPTWGEELYTQMGFFCSDNFGLSRGWKMKRNESGKSSSSVEFEIKKFFFEIRFFFRGVIEV